MPLLNRSLSDSQLYSSKISQLSTRIYNHAHHPEGFTHLADPRTFNTPQDWLTHWSDYHKKVNYWLPLFHQVNDTLQQYRMVYQKYTSIVDKQEETNVEIETNKTLLESLHQQSKIDFFETERLENKIMILEKKSREAFSPELKQQLVQNYQRYLDWKNQESVINIQHNYTEWKIWEQYWRNSYQRLFQLIPEDHSNYLSYSTCLSDQLFDSVEKIISIDWFQHDDINLFDLDTLDISSKKEKLDTLSQKNVVRKDKLPSEIPNLKFRLQRLEKIKTTYQKFRQEQSRLQLMSCVLTNLLFYFRNTIFNLSLMIYNAIPWFYIIISLCFLFQASISYFPKYSGFIVHSAGREIYNIMYHDKIRPLTNFIYYFKKSHVDLYYNWRRDTFDNYQIKLYRLVELGVCWKCFSVFYLTGLITIPFFIGVYWNWCYLDCSSWTIFQPYQAWIKDRFKTEIALKITKKNN